MVGSQFSSSSFSTAGDWCVLGLACGAWVGNAAVLLSCLNWLYGSPISRKLLHAVRSMCGLLVVTSPIGFCLGFGLEIAGWQFGAHTILRTSLVSYGYFCCILGFGVVPGITLWRLLRRPPAALLEEKIKTIDIAKELGFAPIGVGKYQHLCRIPGNQVFQVDFSERTLRLPRLPTAWDGLTILHLSDLHLMGTPDRSFFHHVMAHCQEWEPDLVALTGDVIDSGRHHRWIVPILGRLRWRIAALAILGNHDTYYEPPLVRRRLRKLGMHVIGNSWEQIQVRGAPLTVIGHEGPWLTPEPDLADCPTETFRLCLSHTPDNIRWARRNEVDLMLSGHNHGGQIRLPVIGSLFVPSHYGRRYDCGTFEEPPTVLHVSRGLSGQHPLRFNCRPEVTRLVLRSATALEASGSEKPA